MCMLSRREKRQEEGSATHERPQRIIFLLRLCNIIHRCSAFDGSAQTQGQKSEYLWGSELK